MSKIPVEIIANEALVVRGGRNYPEDIQRAIGTHPSGITGISVECAVELSVAELALAIPHGQVVLPQWLKFARKVEMSSVLLAEV
ncbi:MAG: hypothetical protein ABI180_13680 [Microcoleus sp.]